MRADSGAIGGDLSEEFQVIAATGEDAIVYCPNSDYAANIEKPSLAPSAPPSGQRGALEKIATPGNSTCQAVAVNWACRWPAPSNPWCWRRTGQ